MKRKETVYDKVNAKVLESLDKGVIPWKRSWSGGIGNRPVNITGRSYTGVLNITLLQLAGFESPIWMTYNQARKNGGHVVKGAKASFVTFWKQVKKVEEQDDGTETKKSFLILKDYAVFNLEQTEGVKIPKVLQDRLDNKGKPNSTLEVCEGIIKGYTGMPDILPGKPAYSPILDKLYMPGICQFDTSENYYKTLFHECVHSTGHADRLNREGVAGFDYFGSEQYSKEELVAEFGAAYLCSIAGIESDGLIQDSASYIEGWSRKIRENPRWLVSASSGAQKAVEYIYPDVREADEEQDTDA